MFNLGQSLISSTIRKFCLGLVLSGVLIFFAIRMFSLAENLVDPEWFSQANLFGLYSLGFLAGFAALLWISRDERDPGKGDAKSAERFSQRANGGLELSFEAIAAEFAVGLIEGLKSREPVGTSGDVKVSNVSNQTINKENQYDYEEPFH